jgi:parallel beta-helix repeat protein
MFLSPLGASPLGAAPLTFYVEMQIGSDPPDRDNCVQPRDPATPFLTINGAFNSGCLLAGDTIIVKPGLYTESVDVTRNFITLRAEPALGAIIQPPSAQGVIVGDLTGVIVEGFIVTGGSNGIDFKNSSDGVVRGNVVYRNGKGISFSGASSGVIENNLVHTNTNLGIQYENNTTIAGKSVAVRNNLVYANGDWGISLQPNATSVGNRVENNTVDRNAHGLRWLIAGSGSLINNVITNNTGTGLRTFDPTKVQENFNNVFGNGSDFLSVYRAGPNTISTDPLYVDPDGPDNLLGGEDWEDDSYHLAQGGLPG